MGKAVPILIVYQQYSYRRSMEIRNWPYVCVRYFSCKKPAQQPLLLPLRLLSNIHSHKYSRRKKGKNEKFSKCSFKKLMVWLLFCHDKTQNILNQNITTSKQLEKKVLRKFPLLKNLHSTLLCMHCSDTQKDMTTSLLILSLYFFANRIIYSCIMYLLI